MYKSRFIQIIKMKNKNIKKSITLSIIIFILVISPVLAARCESPNFVITTNVNQETTNKFCAKAEADRKQLAIDYYGGEMPNWGTKIPIEINVNKRLGAGGATSFYFDHGEVFGWRGTMQGSEQRILDSVIPHEIMHTISASILRQPLPRWADEGISTSTEDISEKQRHRKMLIEFLQSRRGIPFNLMFEMKEYPKDIMPLYAQGYSLTEFLMDLGGKRKFGDFLNTWKKYKEEGKSNMEAWKRALKDNYGTSDLGKLQNEWLKWVAGGFQNICTEGETKTS